KLTRQGGKFGSSKVSKMPYSTSGTYAFAKSPSSLCTTQENYPRITQCKCGETIGKRAVMVICTWWQLGHSGSLIRDLLALMPPSIFLHITSSSGTQLMTSNYSIRDSLVRYLITENLSTSKSHRGLENIDALISKLPPQSSNPCRETMMARNP